MSMRRTLALGAVLIGGAMAAEVLAAPEPARATKSWELDFAFHDLERIRVTLPGETEPTTFWYLLYTVTNNTGRDIEFYPTFELVTNSLEVVIAGENISPTVSDAIAAQHRKVYPFYQNPLQAAGKLLQGADNARTSAAIFQNFDLDANSLSVHVAGLSGEVARVPNPAFDTEQPETDQNRPFFALRKTLAIQYDVPGDRMTRRMATAVRRGQTWVMR